MSRSQSQKIARVRFDDYGIEPAFDSPYPAALVGKGNVPLLNVCSRCYKYTVDSTAADLHSVWIHLRKGDVCPCRANNIGNLHPDQK